MQSRAAFYKTHKCVSTFLNTIIDMSNTIANAFTKSITARCADSLLWAVGVSEEQITWLP